VAISELFIVTDLSVFTRIVQRYLSVLAGVKTVNQASVERPRVDVQAYRALVELSEVEYLVHRFGRIDLGRHEPVNVERIGCFQTAISGCSFLIDYSKVLYSKFAGGYRHPAVLIVVIVNLRYLPNFPADRYQFKESIFEDQVAGIVILAEEGVGLERGFIYRMILDVLVDSPGAKVFLGYGT
jgi:hypothetical protein